VCRGGCTWTSHSLLGKPGNNPYCHYRVLELKKQGLRERIEKIEDAAPASFAVGRFDLVTERISDGTPVSSISRSGQTVELAWKHKGKRAPEVGRVPPRLVVCRACNSYVHQHESRCPHCGADIAAAERAYEHDAQRRHALIQEVERLLS
jgi:rRNA maturation protein Nop10